MERRTFLTGLMALGVALQTRDFARGAIFRTENAANKIGAEKYPFRLPSLPFAYGALEPHIDAQTMEIHHSKHHDAYVKKLNEALLKYPDWQNKTLLELLRAIKQAPKDLQTALRNHGGGHFNHSFFWEQLTASPTYTGDSTAYSTQFQKKFGNHQAFTEQFSKAALSVFGSGWAWLVKLPDGALEIITTANQDNPLMDVVEKNGTPLLALDVWEHAYYLKYQNVRADYIKAFWNVLSWETVSKRYD